MMPSPPNIELRKFNITEARLRTNPAYELVLFDRLSEFEQQALSTLAKDPECYGILRPRDGHLGVKSVSLDTALLLLTLQEAGPLPRYAIGCLGENYAELIARMVLDGVLEIEVEGEMVSGPNASALFMPAAFAEESQRSLAALSRRAVAYGAVLALTNPVELSARLYSYHCLPASRHWRGLLPGEETTAEYLGLAGGPAASLLLRDWVRQPESEAWISWRRRDAGHGSEHSPGPIYKLYVSPACEHLREAVLAVVESLARSSAMQWKVGRGVYGLLRPDKLVVYFASFAGLQETALQVMTHLETCPAHGVPFTAELGGRGLLSWGIDEPGEARAGLRSDGESWRSRICDRLALALIQASDSRSAERIGNVSAAEFALARLHLDGIDTATWTPAAAARVG